MFRLLNWSVEQGGTDSISVLATPGSALKTNHTITGYGARIDRSSYGFSIRDPRGPPKSLWVRVTNDWQVPFQPHHENSTLNCNGPRKGSLTSRPNL